MVCDKKRNVVELSSGLVITSRRSVSNNPDLCIIIIVEKNDKSTQCIYI